MTKQKYKSGNEFLPYHPAASHVEPSYRDGWNACWQAAIASREPQWLPIGSAPKDDDALILVANSEGTWVAQYRPVYQSGFVPNCPWSSMLMNHDHIRFQKSFRPTHWMPLPLPPKD